mmetsp:Transcript_23612/g.42431  ORF Transcript_23612/g.42431 Transcript_23612/m.42431 type:complete len:209 (+) Transcript_23612:2563-3189(+)
MSAKCSILKRPIKCARRILCFLHRLSILFNSKHIRTFSVPGTLRIEESKDSSVWLDRYVLLMLDVLQRSRENAAHPVDVKGGGVPRLNVFNLWLLVRDVAMAMAESSLMLFSLRSRKLSWVSGFRKIADRATNPVVVMEGLSLSINVLREQLLAKEFDNATATSSSSSFSPRSRCSKCVPCICSRVEIATNPGVVIEGLPQRDSFVKV